MVTQLDLAVYDPQEHEPLCDDAWNEDRARAFILRVVEEADKAFDPKAFWPLHPEDAYGEEPGSYRGLYSGAAGTMWGLHRLSQTTSIRLKHDYASAIVAVEEAYRSNPWETATVVPGYFMGTTGILAARYAITRDERVLDALERDARSNIGNKTRELFWGSAGCAIAALLVRAERNDGRFDGVLADIQDEYWKSWSSDARYPLLWLQEMYGKKQRYVGVGHGAFGNVMVFIRASDLLTQTVRDELHRRIVALLSTYALQDGDAANWISMAEPAVGNRMQWCHGAPGIIMALASYPQTDARIETYLQAGAQAIWQAGPLKKGPNFCHGTAGNGYALLRIFQRTGEAVWLERARCFAMHAIGQVDDWRRRFGMPAFSLWSGEIGIALFVDSILRKDPAVLAMDVL
jgi:lantibiotic modifying enzyme